MVPCGCRFRSCGRGVRQQGDILNLNRAWHAPQPSPERTGGAQFLGGCLGKPGDCVLSPDTRPSTRARHASQSDPIAHGVVSDCPRRRVAARIGRSYSCGFRGSQAPGQTAHRPSAAQHSLCRGDCAWAEIKASRICFRTWRPWRGAGFSRASMRRPIFEGAPGRAPNRKKEET